MATLTGHSPIEEADIQRSLLDALQNRFEDALRKELSREARMLASEYASLGFLPTASLEEHKSRVHGIYRRMYSASIRTFGMRIVRRGKDAGKTVEVKNFDSLFAALIDLFLQLEAIRRRITSVSETTRNLVLNVIKQGQDEGLGIEEIARMIRERIPAMTAFRSAMIVRTETHAAANFGAQQTAAQTGLELEKEWVSVRDHRTRDFIGDDVDEYDHRSMNGQTVPLDGKFKMPRRAGGFILVDFPGDPTAPAGAVINCRCAVVHNII